MITLRRIVTVSCAAAFLLALALSCPAFAIEGSCISVTCYDGSTHPCGFDCSTLSGGRSSFYPVVPQPRHMTEAERSQGVQALNDDGVDAYENGNFRKAHAYFSAALTLDPYNPGILDNLNAAFERIANGPPWVPSYLANVNTSLDVYSLSPSLLIFNPSPEVRAEAQRQMIEETMKQIGQAAADFVIQSRLFGAPTSPIRWDTQIELDQKRMIAFETAGDVRAIQEEAAEEARLQALRITALSSGGRISMNPGPALGSLLWVCEGWQ